jgi:CRISPR-associated endonuclease/helicase Cas3
MQSLQGTNIQKLISLLLQAYPDGLTTGQIAPHIGENGVTEQTVRNYIVKLESLGVPVSDDKRHYWIEPSAYKQYLALNFAEAWLLYLSQRRVVRAQQNRFPVMRQLLAKLAKALHHDLAEQINTAPANEPAEDFFSVLVDGWQRHQTVRVRYRPLDKPETTFVIAPRWFEPSVWTDSNYCIAGIGPQFEQHITLKLDRVIEARLLDERFPRKNVHELVQELAQSWGIWTGDHPTIVRLRFRSRLYDRLHETIWHPTQTLEVDVHGEIRWSALISEVQEMLPWIRSWGADVEVLEPPMLRQRLIEETQRLSQMYLLSPDDQKSFF